MMFAAQVEVVAHTAVLVGTHGQGLFNLVFLPRGGAVVEIPPCGTPLSLVYNVAQLFGFEFADIPDTSCEREFMDKYNARGCVPCQPREVDAAGGSTDLDSEHVGDCDRMDPACDVRSVQLLTLNNVERAATVIRDVHAAASMRLALKNKK